MKLTRLLLGLVVSTGLFSAACGSSDSSNDDSPTGGSGGAGTYSCVFNMTCKDGNDLVTCCTSTQCKLVLGGTDYPCNGQDCQAVLKSTQSKCR